MMNLIIIFILLFIEKQFPQRKCKYLLGGSCVLLLCSQPGALNFPWHNVWRPSNLKVGTALFLHRSTQTDEFASLVSEQWCRGSLGELHSSFVHFAVQGCPPRWTLCRPMTSNKVVDSSASRPSLENGLRRQAQRGVVVRDFFSMQGKST